jgi:hypothetical protein
MNADLGGRSEGYARIDRNHFADEAINNEETGYVEDRRRKKTCVP